MLFAASCILVALHPSHVASALIEGNQEISDGLEWIRTWALHIAESDPDAECSTVCILKPQPQNMLSPFVNFKYENFNFELIIFI